MKKNTTTKVTVQISRQDLIKLLRLELADDVPDHHLCDIDGDLSTAGAAICISWVKD